MNETAKGTVSISITRYLLGGLVAGVVGGIIANLWYLIWQLAGGGTYAELNIFTIIMAGVVPGLIGALFFYALTRFTRSPQTIFVVAGLVFAALSILPNFLAPVNPAPGFGAVASPMHVIVALSILAIVPLFAKQGSKFKAANN